MLLNNLELVMNANDHALTIAFVREATAAQMLGVSKRTIQRWEKEGGFPRKVKLGKNTSAYKLEEIERWIEERCNAGKSKS